MKEKYIRFEHGDHFMYSFELTDGEIARMVETIETGTVNKAYTSLSFLTRKNFKRSLTNLGYRIFGQLAERARP